jgi:hypothetical protein
MPQTKLPHFDLGRVLCARGVREPLLLVLWLTAGWLGFDSLDRIREAYRFACADAACRDIDGPLGFLGLSVLVNLVAIPLLIGLLLRTKSKS